jgi:selenocysteine-specific elongation factor
VKAIIGTAGHIDHGKTALVKALTGADTDRLPQERARGISIELGFAYLELPGGDRAGIVDVPGHERFIRQMLAGAQGFDLVLFVVAADDGVMPQTEEHFEICHLLGVRAGLFVVTKCDLVDETRIDDVRSEIEILAAGTPFEGVPVIAVSAHSGAGIESLREAIVERLTGLERPAQGGDFRMPVDRAFVLKGHGVVVTGTAAAGSIAPGEEIEIAPHATRARVREVQVHGSAVERAWAGQRVAVNLAGVDRTGVTRGDLLVTPGTHADTDRFDAAVEIRPSARRPVSSHDGIRLHVGTADVRGRIVWLGGRQEVAVRERGHAQIVLREPTVVFPGDRFVLRDETASRTLGGGVVLVARARRHGRRDTDIVARLRALEGGDDAERLRAFAGIVDGLGPTPEEAARGTGIPPDRVLAVAAADDELALVPEASDPQLLVLRERWDGYLAGMLAELSAFHEKHPKLGGMELERLRARPGFDLDARLFRSVVDGLVADGRIDRRGSRVMLPGHEASLSGKDEQLAAAVLSALHAEPATPPSVKQLPEHLGVAAERVAGVLGVLAERGDIVRVTSDLAFTKGALDEIERKLRAQLGRDGEITAAGFRDLISASRKYSIPLLDYFDRCGVTIRSGDLRRLRSV